MTPTDILSELRRDEGEVLHAYADSLGYLTIGIGRLIDERKGGGISRDESAYLFANDISRVDAGLDARLPWWRQLDDVRRGVLRNMCFQMGIGGLTGFVTTLRLVKAGRYGEASVQMLKSKWARQTPERAYRLAQQMREGNWI